MSSYQLEIYWTRAAPVRFSTDDLYSTLGHFQGSCVLRPPPQDGSDEGEGRPGTAVRQEPERPGPRHPEPQG